MDKPHSLVLALTVKQFDTVWILHFSYKNTQFNRFICSPACRIYIQFPDRNLSPAKKTSGNIHDILRLEYPKSRPGGATFVFYISSRTKAKSDMEETILSILKTRPKAPLTFPREESILIIPISIRKIALGMATLSVGLGILSMIGQLALYWLGTDYVWLNWFAQEFNVGAEYNIPTLYQVLSILFCAFLLFFIGYMEVRKGARFCRHWKALALVFVYLSIDEGFELHEKLVKPMRTFFHASGYLHHAWVIPGIVIVMLFALTFLKFFLALPPRTRFLFFMSAAVYVGGAIGVEVISGQYVSEYSTMRVGDVYWMDIFGAQDFVYPLLNAIEEVMEMLGMAIYA